MGKAGKGASRIDKDDALGAEEADGLHSASKEKNRGEERRGQCCRRQKRRPSHSSLPS